MSLWKIRRWGQCLIVAISVTVFAFASIEAMACDIACAAQLGDRPVKLDGQHHAAQPSAVDAPDVSHQSDHAANCQPVVAAVSSSLQQTHSIFAYRSSCSVSTDASYMSLAWPPPTRPPKG